MKSDYVIPVILAGGKGSRLWPLSRESFPKQFLSFDSFSDKTLLQKTIERVNKIKNITDPIIICNEDYRFIVAEQIKQINVKALSILLEPYSKNTAPAIALAALKSLEITDNPTLLVMSSDHYIKNKEKFTQVIENGIKYAEEKQLVTFGIVPNAPETGYGYIKSEEELDPIKINGERISQFLEKPDLETAKYFIKDKRFTWNSGIFLFKANILLNEMENYCLNIITNCRKSFKNKLSDLDFERIDKNSFKSCPNKSIDIALMEKTNKGIVLPLDVGWSDIGSWSSVWDISEKNKDGNFTNGKIISHNNKNCYLRSENKLLVGIGLEDLIVVDTSDATLIAKKDFSQELKIIVNELKSKGIEEGTSHKKVLRPWGNYESIASENRWQVKLITVQPGNKLSLQMHHHRAEHWIVVKGTAKVEIDEKEIILGENQSTYIPLGSKHRLINPGRIPLILIEVQSGAYLKEDDIIRFDDTYGRI
tara:strand:+ start:3446 stop:4882 length:1437 start_codon:yes stop_codon:yes gene_type:complete